MTGTGFVCIGVPYFIGEQLEERTEVAQIRDSGLAVELDAPWIDLAPDFDAETNPVIAVNRALAETIAAQADRVPLVFAADCTSAVGMVKGLSGGLEPDLGVIWYDAHGDFNTPETSPSGFLGGMPLAMLVGRGDLWLMDGVGVKPVAEQAIIITDARDLDPPEARALAGSAIHHLPDVRDLLTAPLPDRPLYIHLDLDVITPDEMPGHSYAAPGGPTLEQVATTIQRVARDGQITGVLFSLWNGSLAQGDDRPLEGLRQLVRDLTGAMTD